MDAEDILNFRSNLLHPNPEIRSFLRPDEKGTTIVIAPKGFGKTLLLKAKRLSIQDKYAHILPSGALVEKPGGLPSVIPTSEYGDLRDSEGYWRSVWLLSFTIAVLKAMREMISWAMSSISPGSLTSLISLKISPPWRTS